jgi:lambda repressor-like predicted transcriptional regulator
MTDNVETLTTQKPEPATPKSEIVKRLLSRKNGATVAEISTATAWQPHSVRAYLSGLRKKGSVMAREERRDGSKSYRLEKVPAAPAGNQ